MSLEKIGILNFYNTKPMINQKLTIKQRYEDFVVKEVSKYGTCDVDDIIKIGDMRIAIEFVMNIIQKQNPDLFARIKNDDSIVNQYLNLDTDKNEHERQNEAVKHDITKNDINLYDIFTEYEMELCEVKNLEKDQRAEIHAIIKKHPVFSSKTKADNTIVVSRVKTNRTYIMTMKKIYKDTITACTAIASMLRIPYNKVSFAGNKDKRAVTYQKITIENSSLSKIKELAKTLNKEDKNLALYDIKQCNSSIKLGELEGNRFEIRIRKATANKINEKEQNDTKDDTQEARHTGNCSENNINDRVRQKTECKTNHGNAETIDNPNDDNSWIDRVDPFVLENGFINYFGQQRFGKNLNNHMIGKAIIDADYQHAIDMIMDVNETENERMRIAKRYYADKKYEEASKLMPFACLVEKNICKGRKNKRSDKKIILGIKREMIKLYLHAYQSYMFNKQVNDKVEQCLNKQELNDLTLDLEVRDNKHMKGDTRKVIERAKDIKIEKNADNVIIAFTLNSSCYATMALREVIGDAVFYDI